MASDGSAIEALTGDELLAVLAVAKQAGLENVRQVIRWGPDGCNVIERDREVEPSLLRQRVATLHRSPADGWMVTGTNTYDFAQVPTRATTLRIPVGGSNPPDPATVGRIVLGLADRPPHCASDGLAIDPEEIVGLWRPPTVAHEIFGRAQAWLGSEFEIYVRDAADQCRVVVVELSGEQVRILGLAWQQEPPASR